VRVQGIEPVAELHQKAEILNGIPREDLREGDLLQLQFADDSFDWVVEMGVLNHIFDWLQAVMGMASVESYVVLISCANNIGQGSLLVRKLMKMIKKLGLLNAFVWVQTKGKISKWSVGDGAYYSFYAFDDLPLLRRKFEQVQLMKTQGSGDAHLLSPVSHVANVATRQNTPALAS